MPKFPLLCGGGNEFVLEGLAHCLLFHRRIFCLIGTKVPMNGNAGESSTRPTARVQTRRLAAGDLSCPENRSNLCKYDDKIFQFCQGGASAPLKLARAWRRPTTPSCWSRSADQRV